MQADIGTKSSDSVEIIIREVVDRIDQYYHGKKSHNKYTTGFTAFDELTNGFQPGLSVIAGRPSYGSLNICY